MTPFGIPRPTLQVVENATPFTHFQCQKMAPGRRYCDVVVVKETYLLAPGRLMPAGEVAEIALADRYHQDGARLRPSLAVPGDLHLPKPGADVFVTGHANAPRNEPSRRWRASVVVRRGSATVASLELEATGPRHWKHRGAGGWMIAEPEPATRTPVRYEVAFGGTYEDPNPNAAERYRVHHDNPCGTGHFDESSLDRSRTYEAPRWELVGSPIGAINRPYPSVGFGPVARMWGSRLRFAGTYDLAWRERLRPDREAGIVPDYASDFDARFFHCAPPALQTASPLVGDEQVGLYGLAASMPELVFQLPGAPPRAEVCGLDKQWRGHPLPLDTVHVDLDAERVHLVWRLCAQPEDGVVAAVILPPKGDSDGEAHR